MVCFIAGFIVVCVFLVVAGTARQTVFHVFFALSFSGVADCIGAKSWVVWLLSANGLLHI